MIPIQPILAILSVCGVVLYFRKLRSKPWDRIIVASYVTIPGLAFASEAATVDGQLQRPIMKRIPDTASSSIPLATTTLVKAS